MQFDSREIEQFLYHEAELLDARQYKEWLELFTDDAIYWMPTGGDNLDPIKTTSLIYDDRRSLNDRLARLLHPSAHSQNPPPRTCHLITNVTLAPLDEMQVAVRSNFSILESRLGVQRMFGGRYEHVLVSEGLHWHIRSKKVCLINNDGVLYYNLTFLF